MIEILNRFLIQHGSISIPGLGTLHAERVPARLSDDSATILPPGNRFRFDKYFDAPDKEFFTYLATRKQVPDFEAMQVYNQFAQDFRADIMTHESAAWPGIGKFFRNPAGEIEFQEDESQFDIAAPVQLKRKSPITAVATDGVSDPEAEPAFTEPQLNELHAIATDLVSPDSKSERWRMITGWIVLGATVASLLFYFGSKGFNLDSAANHSPLPTTLP